MKKLQNPQQEIYNYLVTYTAEHSYPPSVREICHAVGLNSTATVHVHLKNLEQNGLIVRDRSKQRSIQICPVEEPSSASDGSSNDSEASQAHSAANIPLVGNVTAGIPILAVENIEDAFPLPMLLTHGTPSDELFMLRVNGESMLNAGIRNGDIIVVHKDNRCDDGDIVVARVQDENVTVKRFFRESNRVRLQPENDLYAPIYVSYSDVAIAGKVIGLLRSL